MPFIKECFEEIYKLLLFKREPPFFGTMVLYLVGTYKMFDNTIHRNYFLEFIFKSIYLNFRKSNLVKSLQIKKVFNEK